MLEPHHSILLRCGCRSFATLHGIRCFPDVSERAVLFDDPVSTSWMGGTRIEEWDDMPNG